MRHLTEAGVADVGKNPLIEPLVELAQFTMNAIYDIAGESRLLMQPAKLAVRAASGWNIDDVEAACAKAAKEIVEMVQPFAKPLIEEHRSEGRLLVLASTSPLAFITALADELGFDAVIGTPWASDGMKYTGELDGPFVWGPEKADAGRSVGG